MQYGSYLFYIYRAEIRPYIMARPNFYKLHKSCYFSRVDYFPQVLDMLGRNTSSGFLDLEVNTQAEGFSRYWQQSDVAFCYGEDEGIWVDSAPME